LGPQQLCWLPEQSIWILSIFSPSATTASLSALTLDPDGSIVKPEQRETGISVLRLIRITSVPLKNQLTASQLLCNVNAHSHNGVMMPPKKKTTIRRKEIVQAALQIIGEKGVHSLTIAEIAGRAGMSDANIYRHFKGKQEILKALGDFISETVMGKAAGIAAGKGSALEKLSVIFRSHASLIAANPGLPRFIFSEEIHLGDLSLAKTIAGKMAGYIETLSMIIAEGVRNGELQSLAPRETAITLLGMIQFTALRWSITRGTFSLDAEAERLWNNFLQLIQAGSPKTPFEPKNMGLV